MAAGDEVGRLLAVAHTTGGDAEALRLACCLKHLFNNDIVPITAMVFNDEDVRWGPPPMDLGARFEKAQETATQFGVELIDWFCCDSDRELIRSARMALGREPKDWDPA